MTSSNYIAHIRIPKRTENVSKTPGKLFVLSCITTLTCIKHTVTQTIHKHIIQECESNNTRAYGNNVGTTIAQRSTLVVGLPNRVPKHTTHSTYYITLHNSYTPHTKLTIITCAFGFHPSIPQHLVSL